MEVMMTENIKLTTTLFKKTPKIIKFMYFFFFVINCYVLVVAINLYNYL